MCSGVVHADVRADEKTQVEFEGMLGRMLNVLGGKTPRDGTLLRNGCRSPNPSAAVWRR
jgi:hypothetical protein